MSDGDVSEGVFWTIRVTQPIMVHLGPLRCPQCDADRDWMAFGAWTDPVRLVCPVGHGWTPWEDDPAKGRSLMQELILASGIEESQG
ncbi:MULTISPECIES: hypothetical protein [unclassified Streptomyces]|uniref:hypothetical protein n=1 Tax=unclassified Streptomyces TaxID=2593676 RepID=UPI00344C3EBC